MPELKFYADEACKTPINNTIEWDSEAIITLFSGEKVKFPNTAEVGAKATTKIWVRNESDYIFYVTSISFPDKRVKITIMTSQLYPNRPVELTISFDVPKNPTPEDIIKSGKFLIEGKYVIVG